MLAVDAKRGQNLKDLVFRPSVEPPTVLILI